MKEQDRKLKALQAEIRDAARAGHEAPTRTTPVRIAEELLDRIVVQRSRKLCKEIEREHNSDVGLLFRPGTGAPEHLYYSDEFDGIRDVLARFLPLFERESDEATPESVVRALSFRIYTWYDVRETRPPIPSSFAQTRSGARLVSDSHSLTRILPVDNSFGE